MDQPEPSRDMGPVVAGLVMACVLAILAVLVLGVWVYYITLPPSPYPMDLPEAALFITAGFPVLSCALFALAWFLGITALGARKARRGSADDAGRE